MKKYIPVLLSFILVSCTSTWEISCEIDVYGIDFRPFAEKNFLFTPGDYYNEYTGLGFVDLIYRPSVAKSSGSKKVYWIGKIDVPAALNSLYSTAVDMGADAVINFEYKFIYEDYDGNHVRCLELRGFAIKRLKVHTTKSDN